MMTTALLILDPIAISTIMPKNFSRIKRYYLMRKMLALVFGCFVVSSAQAADIPYCSGTKVTGSKHVALQQLVHQFAGTFDCKIGRNCILNFNKIYYHIAWDKWCPNPVSEPQGTTFVCTKGKCTPTGTDRPATYYKELAE